MNFPKFLKRLDERLSSEYVLELLKDQVPPNNDSQFITSLKFDNINAWNALIKLPKISSLSPYHPAWKYIVERKIPNEFHAIFRWCSNFMTWTNQLIPGKFEEKALQYDEGRILIPFFNKDRHFFAYTGRSLLPIAEVRYITIVLNSNEPLLWGLDRLNYKKHLKVVEGPLDATFLNNCIALGGGNFSSLTKLATYDKIIMILDNEPRSRETKAKIEKAIEHDFKVVIWPDTIKEKDINAMILAGYSPDYIEHIITTNTFEGIEAKMRLTQWSKR